MNIELIWWSGITCSEIYVTDCEDKEIILEVAKECKDIEDYNTDDFVRIMKKRGFKIKPFYTTVVNF